MTTSTNSKGDMTKMEVRFEFISQIVHGFNIRLKMTSHLTEKKAWGHHEHSVEYMEDKFQMCLQESQKPIFVLVVTSHIFDCS